MVNDDVGQLKPAQPTGLTLAIMRNDQWKAFFLACRDVLGKGANNSQLSESWCAWTTFAALKFGGIRYWTCGIPNRTEIHDTHIEDGGLWGQPFLYDDIAHVVARRLGKLPNIDAKRATLADMYTPIPFAKPKSRCVLVPCDSDDLIRAVQLILLPQILRTDNRAHCLNILNCSETVRGA